MVNQRLNYAKIILLIGLAMAESGCATVDIPNVGEGGYKVEDDERRLYKRSEEMSEELDESGFVESDLRREGYLNSLANTLLPQDIKDEGVKITVKILNDPTLNAFALPNGRIYVHLGIVAAMDNEAQLVTLLSHEMTHVINRHALKQFRSLTNKSAFWTVMEVPIAVAGGPLASILVQVTALSSIYGYSQEMEYEADEKGFSMILAQGYDGQESPKLFEHLKEFIKEEEIKQPFFFSTHPALAARIKNYKGLAAKENISFQEMKVNSEDFDKLWNEVALKDAGLCLEHGMFKTAKRHADKYILRNSRDPQGYYYLGEIYRQRHDPETKKEKKRDKREDYRKALEAYQEAINLDSAFSLAYKGKAQVLQKENNTEEARSAYRRYLELEPGAQDREYVEQFILKE